MSRLSRRFFPSSSVSASSTMPPISILSFPSLNIGLVDKNHALTMRKNPPLCQGENQRRYQHNLQCQLQGCQIIIVQRQFPSWSLSRTFASGSESKETVESFKDPSSFQASKSLPSKKKPTTARQPSSMTMKGLWKESTARLLHPEETPIGSMTSLQWHLAETLILYWASSQGDPPPLPQKQHAPRRGKGRPPRGTRSDQETTAKVQEKWFRATKEGNAVSLQILDRLAKEKVAAETLAASNTGGKAAGEEGEPSLDGDDDDDDDFRTIDVSLIHSVLKQWKDGLHWANNNKKNDPRSNANSRHPHQHRQSNEQGTISNESAAPSEILLPSELLQKLDSWSCLNTATTSVGPPPLFEPNIATYTILMDGAVSCRNYRERVTFSETLLDRLLSQSSGSSLLEISNADVAVASRLRPTVVTIGTVIHALANSRTRESAEKAEAWLRRIPSFWVDAEDGGLARMRPNTIVYTTVIRAWADVGRADKAEGLLREMCREYVGMGDGESNPDAKPSLWTFNTVLAAWSRSKDPSSVIQAEGLIRTMKSLSSSSRKEGGNPNEHHHDEDYEDEDESFDRNSVLKLDVAPTIVSYNSLMSTIASRCKYADSLQKAEYWMEEILANAAAVTAGRKPTPLPRNRSRQGHKMGGRKNDDSMAPNFITYRALFNIIAAASNLSNTEKADRMRYWLARGGSPSISSRNSNSNNLMDNSYLLEQIDAMEQGGNNKS